MKDNNIKNHNKIVCLLLDQLFSLKFYCWLLDSAMMNRLFNVKTWIVATNKRHQICV